ncbi:YkgJ family cysteine cluster protein [Desulfosporosinus burensis]
MLNEQEVKRLIENPMKPTDTFKFSCKACGNCCRNRQEPILLTGYDVFRIAKGLRIEMQEVVTKYTIGYVGGTSNLPVLTLKERQDGSCSLLRKGKCMVHDNKPLVCAIYPLGRYYLPAEKRFGYFQQEICCGTAKEQTLEEWLNIFNVHEWDEAASLWATVITKLAEQTMKIKEHEDIERMANLLAVELYFDYDTNKSYTDQLAHNISQVTR